MRINDQVNQLATEKEWEMKNDLVTKVLPAFLVCLLIAITGCCIQIGCGVPLAKYERTVQVSAPMAANGLFAAQTHNGSITISGAEVADCNLTATVTARAGSTEDAKRLAEATKIKLEPFGNKLTARIERPSTVLNQSVRVSLDVVVPNQTDLELATHNGAVKIENISGRTNATTHNGKITASAVSGTTKLRTHNGFVGCRDVSGDIRLRTHNGDVRAGYSKNASPVCDVSIVAHNGDVDFTAPPNFSAVAEVSTHNGSIKTNLPISVIGKVSRRKLTGTIGTGQGKLHLQTYNGSIKIK